MKKLLVGVFLLLTSFVVSASETIDVELDPNMKCTDFIELNNKSGKSRVELVELGFQLGVLEGVRIEKVLAGVISGTISSEEIRTSVYDNCLENPDNDVIGTLLGLIIDELTLPELTEDDMELK
jgi:hypothetical protein